MSAQPQAVLPQAAAPVSKAVIGLTGGGATREGSVVLTNELVGLLSSQLYRTPIKAVEELVVNSFDADAAECHLAVPSPDTFVPGSAGGFVAVLDDGLGMDDKGLIALWEIGKSRKRDEETSKRYKRAQIGKFGIGKLATYAIANCVTYISKSESGIYAVTLDYREFKSESESTAPVRIKTVKVDDWLSFCATLDGVLAALHVGKEFFDKPHWTLCLLEDLKERVTKIRLGRLSWVLRTAMPFDPTNKFQLFLGGDEIKSSKSDYEIVISFKVTELPQSRLDGLNSIGQENWRVVGDSIVSKTFPSGIRGAIDVFDRALTGKSDDLGRSNGFFIRVRGRLLNEDDPLFGMEPLSFQTFNRFRAELQVNDLDPYVLSSREEIENADAKQQLERFLNACFNEARIRFEAYELAAHNGQKTKQEEQRQYVDSRLVERPVADVLTSSRGSSDGSEADDSWFYLRTVEPQAVEPLIDRLYSQPRTGYTYLAENLGKTSRIVKFDVEKSEFTINLDHEFVQSHYDDLSSRRVLYDFVTAEALLEVHLREEGVPSHIAGDILERRDRLLRGLATDHAFSPKLIAQSLKDSAANQYDLEIALVRAARTLGFVATHISGSGEPDGIARLMAYPGGELKITLEAKSSGDVPQLGQLDMAGIQEHYTKLGCQGVLMIAPSYPGSTRGEESALAYRAKQAKVSCWTIDQLASVVENVETRHITAKDVLDIVASAFSPDEVASEVEKLLSAPQAKVAIYREVLTAFRQLSGVLQDEPRSIDMIKTAIVIKPGFSHVTGDEIRTAVKQMAGASKGGLHVANDQLTLRISLDELENRLSGLLNGDSLAGAPGRGRGGVAIRDQTWSE
ncbi:HSP90 family protein [Burkholderia pseudomallei]|nr:HSP90 family protein [Burkholderia pseudomallei]CAJ4479466.1 HSP90 family protein [Burkholderia pseudomallei]CAJ4866640.1 HSP90 family protein [Burkholderia pseudomallei]CAJ6447156.1 HSP90 family protein [Burkholderia pseudomallei]CAJ9650359.1 HSP90 family protein [Burkholderia pseudomallei]